MATNSFYNDLKILSAELPEKYPKVKWEECFGLEKNEALVLTGNFKKNSVQIYATEKRNLFKFCFHNAETKLSRVFLARKEKLREHMLIWGAVELQRKPTE